MPGRKKSGKGIGWFLGRGKGIQGYHSDYVLTDEAEAYSANQEMAFDDWRRQQHPVPSSNQVKLPGLNPEQFPHGPGMPSRMGPKPLSYSQQVGPDGVNGPDGVEHPEWWGRKWTDIEAGITQDEAKRYETVCIWCGITCESIAALEVHEAICE